MNYSRQAADHIKRFVGENLVLDPKNVVPASNLYAAYTEWCSRNGEQPLNDKELKGKLGEAADITHKRTRRGSDWIGAKLKP